jgi:hypothetical protein
MEEGDYVERDIMLVAYRLSILSFYNDWALVNKITIMIYRPVRINLPKNINLTQ